MPGDLPAGVGLRPARPADLGAVAGLLAAVEVTEYGEADSDDATVREAWGRPGFDVSTDAWVALDGEGRLVGYVDVWGRDEHDFDVDAYVRPGLGRAAVEAALLDVAVARAGALAGPGALAHTVRAGPDVEGQALAESLGWEPVRVFTRMGIHLARRPAVAPPAGVTVRAYRPGTDDRAIHHVIEAGFAGHFRHAREPLEDWLDRRRSAPGHDPAWWALAWEFERPIGAVRTDDTGDAAFVREVAVLAAERGRGVGAALLAHAFGLAFDRGRTHVVLGVDTANTSGALGLYRGAGMAVERAYHVYRHRLGASGPAPGTD